MALAGYFPHISLLWWTSRPAVAACVGVRCGNSTQTQSKSSLQKNRGGKPTTTQSTGTKQPAATKRSTATKNPSPNATATPETNPVTLFERQIQTRWFSLIVGFVLGMIACQLLRSWATRVSVEKFHPEWLFVAIALAGAAGHTLFVDTKFGATWEPSFDTTTLLWLAAAAAGILYPQLSKLTFLGVGFELQTAALDATTVVTETLTITDKWASRLNEALCDFPKKSVQELSLAISNFLAQAAEDATKWLGKDKEVRRLAYWIVDKNKELGLAVSNEITVDTDPEVCKFRFKAGYGLTGTAITERDPINVADA